MSKEIGLLSEELIERNEKFNKNLGYKPSMKNGTKINIKPLQEFEKEELKYLKIISY